MYGPSPFHLVTHSLHNQPSKTMRNEDYRSGSLLTTSTLSKPHCVDNINTNLMIPLPHPAKFEIQRFSMIPNTTLARGSKKLHNIRIVAPLSPQHLHQYLTYSIFSPLCKTIEDAGSLTHSHDPRSWEIFSKEIPGPEDAIFRPGMVSFPAQAVYEDDIDEGIAITCI